MDWLFSLYIISSFFGAGVMLVDLLGMLGHHTDGGGHSSHAGTHNDSSHLADHSDTGPDHGQTDIAAGHGHTDSSAMQGHGSGAANHAHADKSHHHSATDDPAGSVASHDNPSKSITPLLRLLGYLRTLVYFAFGFGPLGWLAWVLGQGAGQPAGQVAAGTLLWSLPGGLLFAIGGRLLRRIQQQELDSSIKEDELLMEQAEVLVSINPGQLGKVRINYSGQYVERYAKARDPAASFPKESKVRIVDVTEEYLIVAED